MQLTIEISPQAEREFGANLKARIEALVEAEALRLYHIRRSQPKSPAETANKEAQKLGEQLLKVYMSKKARMGQNYPPRFAAQEQEIHALLQKGDTAGLRGLLRAQKWQDKP